MLRVSILSKLKVVNVYSEKNYIPTYTIITII